MEKKIQDIIENNTFDQLSEQSLLELKDWCTTRDEFNQLKSLFESLSTLQQKSNLEPKKQTKESLDALFMKKHSMGKSVSLSNSILRTIYPIDKEFYKRPLVQLAALIVIVLLILPFLNAPDKLISSQNQVANIKADNASSNNEKLLKKNELISDVKKDTPVKIAQSLPVNETIQFVELAKMEFVEVSDYSASNDEPMVIDAFVQEESVVSQPMGKTMKKENAANKDQVLINDNQLIINLISTTY
ncbi:MAG: hypothetical protein KA521_04380 [Crocinitomicaceae bacterium]|nr:hypothetical protein [Crocinitomicaceae bacterium]